ncbi:trophoblast glycoprotein b [Pygocentrus nattereri]|uniref:trophoblast glycoprotein b n=1 Tax=Pygocentrus nattereri TaxID=42514 RepID=UPI00081480EF|nr:trophoblast glycoprotein b [Pygocentrus nattereri]
MLLFSHLHLSFQIPAKMLAVKRKRAHRLLILCVLLFLSCFGPVSSLDLCDECHCKSTTVTCLHKNLMSIPQPLPANITTLFLTGNNISHLNESSFPVRLEQLTELYLSGNQMEQVDRGVFNNLPNLHSLDLSNNRILSFSRDAIPENNKLRVLNLSQSLYNVSYTDISNLLKHSFPKLSNLDLSNNDLKLFPDGISSLSDLATLDMRNNSVVSINNVTFRSQVLQRLDLRDNALKDIPNGTLADLSQIPGLWMYLTDNPWYCDCKMKDMVIWLQKFDFVADKANMTCFEPSELRNAPLLQVDQTKLQCNYSGNMKGVMETSYVFLGMVLALIGVIFLLVLYLNRKGIKRWMYNIRDACRDHMEGYHYRYEINSDPRLANLSLNSDV